MSLFFMIPRDPDDAKAQKDRVRVPPEVITGGKEALENFYAHECEKRWQHQVTTSKKKRGN